MVMCLLCFWTTYVDHNMQCLMIRDQVQKLAVRTFTMSLSVIHLRYNGDYVLYYPWGGENIEFQDI